MWRVIKAFKGNNFQIRSPLEVDDKLIYDIQEKAELIVKQLQKTMFNQNMFDHSIQELQIIDTAANDRYVGGYNDLFNKEELNNAIDNLKPKKAYGADDVHNSFIKRQPDSRKEELLGILNRIWRKGKFPEKWKLAQVIPILKPCKPARDITSYRPIALLSCLSKVMEKMVSD